MDPRQLDTRQPQLPNDFDSDDEEEEDDEELSEEEQVDLPVLFSSSSFL
jgi:hypothetical protein